MRLFPFHDDGGRVSPTDWSGSPNHSYTWHTSGEASVDGSFMNIGPSDSGASGVTGQAYINEPGPWDLDDVEFQMSFRFPVGVGPGTARASFIVKFNGAFSAAIRFLPLDTGGEVALWSGTGTPVDGSNADVVAFDMESLTVYNLQWQHRRGSQGFDRVKIYKNGDPPPEAWTLYLDTFSGSNSGPLFQYSVTTAFAHVTDQWQIAAMIFITEQPLCDVTLTDDFRGRVVPEGFGFASSGLTYVAPGDITALSVDGEGVITLGATATSQAALLLDGQSSSNILVSAYFRSAPGMAATQYLVFGIDGSTDYVEVHVATDGTVTVETNAGTVSSSVAFDTTATDFQIRILTSGVLVTVKVWDSLSDVESSAVVVTAPIDGGTKASYDIYMGAKSDGAGGLVAAFYDLTAQGVTPRTTAQATVIFDQWNRVTPAPADVYGLGLTTWGIVNWSRFAGSGGIPLVDYPHVATDGSVYFVESPISTIDVSTDHLPLGVTPPWGNGEFTLRTRVRWLGTVPSTPEVVYHSLLFAKQFTIWHGTSGGGFGILSDASPRVTKNSWIVDRWYTVEVQRTATRARMRVYEEGTDPPAWDIDIANVFAPLVPDGFSPITIGVSSVNSRFEQGAISFGAGVSCPSLVGPCDCTPFMDIGDGAHPTNGQPIQDEAVATGDGSTQTFYTGFPYQATSLEVEVDGILVKADPSNPATGAFTLSFPPALGERITVTYQVTATPALVGYPPDTTLTSPAPNADARPAYLTEITDSTWGTKIRRITNTYKYRNQYARHQSWNKSGSRMFFPGYGGHLYDGTTYADLGAPSGYSITYGLWSNLHASYIYGIVGSSNVFARYDISSDTQTNLHTFGGYSTMYVGNYEGNLSDDDRVSILGDGRYVVVYDITTDTVISTTDTGTTSIDNCSTSRDGAYFVVSYATTGGGATNGVWVYNAATGASIRQIRTNSGGHADQGRNAGGEAIYVHVNDDGTGTVSHRLSDGTVIFLIGGVGGVCHVSCTNYDRWGWAYISSTYSGVAGGYGQVFAVRTDGSQIVEVFGFHHHGSETDYDSSPFAAANRDGTRVTFGGAWGGNPASDIYGFVMGVST